MESCGITFASELKDIKRRRHLHDKDGSNSAVLKHEHDFAHVNDKGAADGFG